jgi:hypothetical protein
MTAHTHDRGWDTVACPKCNAGIGVRCTASSGAPASKAHEARWRLFYGDRHRRLGPLAPTAALLGDAGTHDS